jgi:hypothetical protein
MGLYPHRVQRVQALQPLDYPAHLQFCQWIAAHHHLRKYILFNNGAQFTWDGVCNTHSHHWSNTNPHIAMEIHFQHRFSVNIWCGIIRNHLIGPFINEDLMNAAYYLNFLQNSLLLLLQDTPLQTRLRMSFQHDDACQLTSNRIP